MVTAGELLLPGSQASTGAGSSPEQDNIDAIIALIKSIQAKGHCNAFKACDESLIPEIATVFNEVGLQGMGKGANITKTQFAGQSFHGVEMKFLKSWRILGRLFHTTEPGWFDGAPQQLLSRY